MKIRSGFVSNSSSSSFILLLPENFVETIDFDNITQGDEDFPIEDFKRLINDFVSGGGIWMGEIYNYNYNYEFSDILYDLTRPYVVASVDSGPDEGQYVVLDRNKLKSLL